MAEREGENEAKRAAADESEHEAERLMQSAWATRRTSFEATPEKRRRLLLQARRDLAAAAEMLRGGATQVSYAQAIHLLANVELDLGHEDRARAHWEKAVAVLRTTGDVLQLAHKVRHLGDLHRHAGRLEQAMSCYAEALAIHRKHDGRSSLDFANALSRMAALREQLGDRDAAIALWRETRDLYAVIAVTQGVEDAERHLERLMA